MQQLLHNSSSKRRTLPAIRRRTVGSATDERGRWGFQFYDRVCAPSVQVAAAAAEAKNRSAASHVITSSFTSLSPPLRRRPLQSAEYRSLPLPIPTKTTICTHSQRHAGDDCFFSIGPPARHVLTPARVRTGGSQGNQMHISNV